MKINIKFLIKSILYFICFLTSVILFYGAGGWFQARKDANALKNIVIEMQDANLGIADLGQSATGSNRASLILKVEDPEFLQHDATDFRAAGGNRTITQSLAKRLAFENFKPGYHTIRQIGYAIGLESALTKDEIFILFLNTARMGRSPTGWIEGFHRASKLHFREPTANISDDEFIELISVLIAPEQLRLDRPSAKRDERIRRIKKLLNNQCTPASHDDVWLEGCAS